MNGMAAGVVVLTRRRLLFVSALFIGSLVAVGLLVYFLADRPLAAGGGEFVRTMSDDHEDSRGTPEHVVVVDKRTDIRLPRSVVPHHYAIRLLPVLEPDNFTVLGHVAIDVECRADTDRVTLHVADIEIDSKSVQVYFLNVIKV